MTSLQGEIGKFFDWIKQFIGYSLREEDDEPILYYVEDKD